MSNSESNGPIQKQSHEAQERDARIASYHDLIAWQKAMDLVDQVYAASAKWPASEFYGLVAQIRRAAVSIPANIAEGHGRNGRREYVYHLGIARGSLCEVETMVMVAARQHYGDGEQARCILSTSTEVGKLLRALLRALGPQ